MSEVKHTPGPWSYYTEPQPNGCPIVGARGLMVAMLAHSTLNAAQHDEAIANAQLIQAAPDMLRALKHARACMAREIGMEVEHCVGGDFTIINAAIAKAEGRSS